MEGKKYYIIFKYLLLLDIIIYCQATSLCGEGCTNCQNTQSTSYQCSQCSKDYELDQKNNFCIYQKCDQNLYLQIEESQNNDSIGSCLSICNPLYLGNSQQKICSKLNSCSTSFVTENNLIGSLVPVDIFLYLEKYYVVFQQGYLSIYERLNTILIKHLNYTDADLNIQNVNGQIYILKKDNTISLWDIISEQKNLIGQPNDIQLNQKSLLFCINNQYILIASQTDSQIIIKILYDYKNKKLISSNSLKIQIATTYYFMNNYLIQIDASSLNITSLLISNESNLIIPINDLTLCDYKDLGTFISFIITTEIDKIYSIFSQGIIQVNLKDKKCIILKKIDKIQKAKFFLLNNQQLSNHLIIQTEISLIDFDCLTFTTKEIKSISQNSIIDFEVGQFLDSSYQLSLLLSSKIIEIYNYDNQSNQFTKIYSQVVRINNVQSIKKIPGSSSSNIVQIYDELALSSIEIQIIRKSINLQQFEDKIIKNYALQYPTPNSGINSQVILYTPQIIVTCHANGDIIFNDISSGYETEFIKRLSFISQTCYSIYKFQNDKVAAQMKNKILLINVFQQKVESELQVSGDNTSVLMTVNKNQMAISSQNCIQIFNQEFIGDFQLCNQPDITNNIIKIDLNVDLKIVIQKSTLISVYQIDLQNKVFTLVKSITSTSQITYFSSIQYYETDQNKIDNQYLIDEIIYYDSNRNFYIYNLNLQLVHSVLGVALLSVNQAKRTTNDKDVYFLIGQTNEANSVVRLHCIVKGKNLSYPLISYEYSPLIDDPIKIVNENGVAYYHVKQILVLNFFTVHQEFMLDINRNITYIYGLDYSGSFQTSSVKKTIGPSQGHLDFVGNNKGTIGVIKYIDRRYTSLNSKPALKQDSNDQIIQVIQSALLGMYFVRTTYKITSFNLFTDKFIEELSPFSSSDPRFGYFKIIEELEGIICYSSSQVLLSVYGDSNNKYYYKGMSQIKGYFFNSDKNKFYFFGSGLVKLDQILNIEKVISEQAFIDCKDSKLYIVCVVSPTLFTIIDKTSEKIIQTVTVKGFTNQFRLGIDEDNQNIFIFDVQIQLYNFLGIYKQTFAVSYGTLNTFAVNGDYVTLFSKTYGVFIHKVTLALQRFASPSGLTIVGHLYVKYLSQIVFFCNTSIVAQLFVYTLNPLTNVSKISFQFPQNTIGVIKDLAFDESSNFIQFLDDQGNYMIYALYGDYAVYNFFKITEIVERKEETIGFSYDYKHNNVLVYTKSNIYKVNYSIVGYFYYLNYKEIDSLYASLPITNSQDRQFLLLNSGNMLFRYENLSIKYEQTFDNVTIKDIRYDEIKDVLILSLTEQVWLLKKYEQSKKDFSNIETIKIQSASIYKFLSNTIYLTFDKRIIHCDLSNGNIIHTISLDKNSFVSSYEFNSQGDILFIGLSNGKLIQYSTSSQKEEYYSINDITAANNIIKFIEIIEDVSKNIQNLLFVSNRGILVEVDFKNKLKKNEFILNQLVNQDKASLLIDFKYDKLFSRYIFFYIGEKKVYVWNTITNSQENYLILTHDQGNKLKLTSKFIITSCSFQLNFYSLQKRLVLLTSIQTNNFQDLLMEYKVINENFIVIFFFKKYEVYLIQGNKNILIDQKSYEYPRFLGYIYKSQTNFMKIYGLLSTGVFELNYNLNIYSDNSIQKCGNLIESKDLTQVKKQIQATTAKTTEFLVKIGRSVTAQSNWKNIQYLKVVGDDFQNIVQFLSQSSYANTQLVIYPLQDTDNNLTISSDTFLSFTQSDFQLSKYNLIFKQVTNKVLNITLSSFIQNIKWQQIKIQQQSISNIQINFSNLKQILFQNVQFLNIQIDQTELDDQNSFILIQNVELVQLNDIYIQDNNISLPKPKKLFVFKNIQKIIINGLTISNNQNIASYFDFQLVKSISISNTNISNNKISKNSQARILQDNLTQNTQIQGILKFFGCNNILLSNIQISKNIETTILQSQSSFMYNNQVTTLIDDELKIENVTLDSQQTQDLQSLFVIKSSFVTINKLKYTSNKGNIIIEDSKRVSISSSQFLKNQAKNGGSIYFKNIQKLIEIKSSLFQENSALSSGGSLYFDNLGFCELIFDDETQISKNIALIGGGIRIVYKDIQTFKMLKSFPFTNTIKNNIAQLYGNDAATYLQKLNVENILNSKQYSFQLFDDEKSVPKISTGKYSQYINIKNFQSGSDILLRIHILDHYNRKLTISIDTLLNGGYPVDIDEELKSIQILIENINLKDSQLIGEKILNYRQYDSSSKGFELKDLQIQAALNTEQYFSMTSSIYSSLITQNPILIGISFRNCIVGEIVQEINQNIMVCKYCSSGSYQIKNPDELYQNQRKQYTSNNNSTDQTHFDENLKNECKNCPESAKSCNGSDIQLKNGYWRSGSFSDEILPCDSSIGSCQAEDSESREGCSEGYIGPLCEECDTIGQVWNQDGIRYAQAVQKGICDACAELYVQWIFTILKILCLAVYFLFTIKVFQDNFKYSQRCYYLRQMQMLPISKNAIKDQSGFYIKIIINYLQISSLLIVQPSLLPKDLNVFSDVIGSSNRQISLGFDCIFSQDFIRSNGKIVTQAMTQALIPVFFIVFMITILSFLQLFQATNITKYYYFTFFHIHLSFFQLEQISYFSKSLACRQIGSKSYTQLDLQILCDDGEVKQFIYPFAIIILTIWSILPLFIVYLLMKKSKNLNECKTKYTLGYYYGELKEDKYYWEFVRMYIKILIIYIHILSSTKLNSLSSYATFIIFCFYIILIIKQKPFISSNLASSEIGAYFLIIIKIFLQSLKQESGHLQIFAELSIAFADYAYILYICTIIIIFKLNNKSSAFGQFGRRVLKKILPFKIFNQIINSNNNRLQTYLRWKLIKKNLQNIIQHKASQNIQVIQTRQKQDSSIMKASTINQSQKSLLQNLTQNQNDQTMNKTPDSATKYNRQFSEKYFQKISKSQQKRFSVFQQKNWNEYDEIIEKKQQQTMDEQTDDIDHKKLEQYCLSSKPSILTCYSSPNDHSMTFDLNKLK